MTTQTVDRDQALNEISYQMLCLFPDETEDQKQRDMIDAYAYTYWVMANIPDRFSARINHIYFNEICSTFGNTKGIAIIKNIQNFTQAYRMKVAA